MTVRAAVIGAGRVGTFHAEKYAALPDVDLVAVVDVDSSRARGLAARLGSRPASDFRAVLGKVDCVSIATPTRSHFAIAAECLQRDVDVLVEKPMTVTAADGRRLVDLADRKHRVLQVGHLERFNPAVRALLAVVDHPRFVESDRLAPFGERGAEVDVVRDLMIHDLDVVLACVGAPVERIEAVGVPVLTDQVDIASVRLRFAGGCIANLTASRVARKRERKIRLFQSDAYFSVDYDESRLRVYRRRVVGGRPEISVAEEEFREADALRDEVESFVVAVRARSVPEIDGRAALGAVELAERINACMETP